MNLVLNTARSEYMKVAELVRFYIYISWRGIAVLRGGVFPSDAIASGKCDLTQ